MSEISRIRPPAGSSGLAADADPALQRVAVGVAQLPFLGSRGSGQPLRLDVIPEAADAVGAQQLERDRVAFEHTPGGVEHDHAPGQRIQQQPQTP